MGKALRKITASVNQSNCAVVFINQLRSNIGGYGNPDTTPGGRALKYAASQRIEMRKTTAIKEGPDVVGNMVKIKVVKNKICPPQQVVELPLIFGKGFSPENEVYQLGVDMSIISKSGSWYVLPTGERFQGMAAVKEFYKENNDAYLELERKVKEKLSNQTIVQEFSIDPDTGEVLDV